MHYQEREYSVRFESNYSKKITGKVGIPFNELMISISNAIGREEDSYDGRNSISEPDNEVVG